MKHNENKYRKIQDTMQKVQTQMDSKKRGDNNMPEVQITLLEQGKEIINNPKIGYILGTLVSDGCFKKDGYGIGLQVKDYDFIKYFMDCVRDVFVDTTGVRLSTSNISIRKSDGRFSYFVNVKEINNTISRLVNGTKTFEWRVPDIIKNNNERVICEFLSAFYDAEGSVYVSKKYKNTYITVSVYSSNYDGLKDIEDLLHSLGINTSFYTLKRKGKKGKSIYLKNKTYLHDIYCISLHRFADIRKFNLMIGFKIKRKQKYVDKYVKNFKYYNHFWTENDINFLCRNYNFYTHKELGKLLRVSSNAVGGMKKKLGLKKHIKERKWELSEIEYLKKNYNKKTDKEMGYFLNKSKNAVSRKRQNIGLIKNGPPSFSKSEEEFIKENYKSISYSKIGKKLGRTKSCISAKVRKMGLSKLNQSEKFYSKEETDFLLKNHNKKTLKEISKDLGRSYYSVCRKCCNLGIKVNKKGKRYSQKTEFKKGQKPLCHREDIKSEDIKNLYYNKKLKMVTIAKIFDCSTRTISRRLKENADKT